ncbi:hypothetical protein C8R45DRAFT_569753 [Mycena sanguinolenta]|nr:hypothetical protein C8R45DRAFT_569753 [Mycena sanguinolenta]
MRFSSWRWPPGSALTSPLLQWTTPRRRSTTRAPLPPRIISTSSAFAFASASMPPPFLPSCPLRTPAIACPLHTCTVPEASTTQVSWGRISLTPCVRAALQSCRSSARTRGTTIHSSHDREHQQAREQRV